MNVDIIKNIPCKIKYDLPHSKFTQGLSLIKSEKTFSDKFDLMTKQSQSSKANDEKYPLQFDDIIMHLSYDINIPKDDFVSSFMNKLEKCDDILKNISHKHRQLKLQITEVFEGKKFIFDFPNVLKFYSDLTKLNFMFIIDEKYVSKFINNERYEYAVIYVDMNSKMYDFTISKTVDIIKDVYKTYLSQLLIDSLKVDELKKIATNFNISIKNKKKSELINELHDYII